MPTGGGFSTPNLYIRLKSARPPCNAISPMNDFEKFVLSPELAAKASTLKHTLEAWQRADLAASHAESAYDTGVWFKYMPNPESYLATVDIRAKLHLNPGSVRIGHVLEPHPCVVGQIRRADAARSALCRLRVVWL